MGLLDWLFGTKKPAALRSFVCSSCYEVKPGEQMHALPWWNAEEQAFFMANRCTLCFEKSLEETSQRIKHWDDSAEKAFCSFLETWKILRHFPQLQAASTHEIADGLLRIVRDTNGKVFVPLAQGGV